MHTLLPNVGFCNKIWLQSMHTFFIFMSNFSLLPSREFSLSSSLFRLRFRFRFRFRYYPPSVISLFHSLLFFCILHFTFHKLDLYITDLFTFIKESYPKLAQYQIFFVYLQL